ncbi:peptidase M50B-like protein [Ruminiclostridium sufflavum DSM 19573]|uniref:Peptidase M50B-like protein n=1 Tax=Ruminiclostridium sufflavum DSM 19573 TaxID=1121337 RepID=A0A318XTQ3_9FIRM|nr:M50 family metallopeptidase [Ruminiclostridium sufflavum]PYG89869.1 peptidase M50B-like protein [Ruminiclostridium sufflavum DSM 19573]
MKQTGRFFIIFIALMVLWNTIFIKPIKLFTVFLHELGHVFMALVTGSSITGIKIYFNESGYVTSLPKDWLSAFLIANGGYLGSVLFAICILLLKNTRLKNYIIGVIAVVFLAVTFSYSGIFSFTMLYSVIFAGFAIIIYMIHNEKLNEWVIEIIGIGSVTYAIYDTFVDTILMQINYQFDLFRLGGMPKTDAVRLAELTHIPSAVWGVVWLAISAFAIYSTLFRKRNTRSRGRKTY